MKASFLIALAAATVNAESISTTSQECWKGEGGLYFEPCNDVYFFTCDVYHILPGESCNVFTFSDSRMEWFSQRVSAVYWTYMESTEAKGEEDPRDPFSVGCEILTPQPTPYSSATKINYQGGICGFKFQVSNSDANTDYEFTVLRDGASTLLASAAAALAVLAVAF